MSVITGLLAAKQAKKARKEQERANQEAETRAIEAAALSETQEDTGADIIFGAAKGGRTLLRRRPTQGPTTGPRPRLTGLGGFGGGDPGRGYNNMRLL
jgi:hypothetical protein